MLHHGTGGVGELDEGSITAGELLRKIDGLIDGAKSIGEHDGHLVENLLLSLSHFLDQSQVLFVHRQLVSSHSMLSLSLGALEGAEIELVRGHGEDFRGFLDLSITERNF